MKTRNFVLKTMKLSGPGLLEEPKNGDFHDFRLFCDCFATVLRLILVCFDAQVEFRCGSLQAQEQDFDGFMDDFAEAQAHERFKVPK